MLFYNPEYQELIFLPTSVGYLLGLLLGFTDMPYRNFTKILQP
jgi:hypothetical protein